MKKVDPLISKYFSKKGKKGAKKRWSGSTKAERSEHARMMAKESHKKRYPHKPAASA